jgi:hypothetical protein
MTPSDHLRRMFGTFDAQYVSRLPGFVTDDVRLRLGGATRVSVFQASAPELDEANAALARTGAFLQAHLQLA